MTWRAEFEMLAEAGIPIRARESTTETLESADTIRLSLETGIDVWALVKRAASGTTRPKCLLLHGNPGSLVDWKRVVPRLSAVADVAAIDLPGFGRSSRPSARAESLSLDCLAQHTIAVATALSWHEPILLVGHSHGGGVAQTVAARYPERVAGLVLIGTLGSPAHGSYRLLSLPGAATLMTLVGGLMRAGHLRGLSRRALHSVMRDIFSPEPVASDKLDDELALFSARPEILLSMVHVALGRPSEQLLRSASEIRCPTLFLHGQQDALVPARCAEAIHERILNAGGRSRFELVPNAGHMLIDFQATEVADSVVRMLRH
jgi:pimeloyl-ACP methyl ester carboxylesterase